jgi:hypothetical protein
MAITATPQDILIHIQVIMIRILEKLDRYFKSNWRLAVLDLEKGRWMIEMHAYPPTMPNQVRFRYGLLTSYCFLKTLPLPTTPLQFGLSSL